MYYLLKTLLALSILLPLLATASVALRFYSRRLRHQDLLADDWLVVLALVSTIVTCALNFYGVFHLGMGNPPPTLTPDQATGSFKVLYTTILLDYFVFGVIKVSVILFYKRLFSVGRFALWANILMVIIVLWTIAGMLAQAFASTPVSNFFVGAFTINWGALNVAMAVLDLWFDVLVLALPLIAISQLQVSRIQKISIIGLFWLGSFCVISSAVRIYFNWEWSLIGPQTDLDWFQYVVSNTNLWLVVEANVSIVAACMPALGGLLRMQAPKLKSQLTFHRSGTGGPQYGSSSGKGSRVSRVSQAGAPHGSAIETKPKPERSWIRLDEHDRSPTCTCQLEKSMPPTTPPKHMPIGDRNGGIRVQTSFTAGYAPAQDV